MECNAGLRWVKFKVFKVITFCCQNEKTSKDGVART